jgi:hypothetical protein
MIFLAFQQPLKGPIICFYFHEIDHFFSHFPLFSSHCSPFAVVGADGENSQKGAAYLFELLQDNVWNQTAKLHSNTAGISGLGSSVAMKNNRAVVGAQNSCNATKKMKKKRN